MATNDNQWIYQVNGINYGPISKQELFRLYQAGFINNDTYIWNIGLAWQNQWMPLSQTGILKYADMVNKQKYVKVIAIILASVAILFFIISNPSPNDTSTTAQKDKNGFGGIQPTKSAAATPSNSPQDTNSTQSTLSDNGTSVKEDTTSKKEYEIVYTINGKRYDGGSNYYVLIPAINPSSNDFKNDIEAIINDIVKAKGKKVSIDIFDSRDALDILYKQYGDMSLGRPRTDAENENLARHSIAGFSGDLETDIFLNTLYFFPSAMSDHVIVGKYVETIEYNPN